MCTFIQARAVKMTLTLIFMEIGHNYFNFSCQQLLELKNPIKNDGINENCSTELLCNFAFEAKKSQNPYLSFSLPSAYFKVCCRGLAAGWVELCHRRLQDNALRQHRSESCSAAISRALSRHTLRKLPVTSKPSSTVRQPLWSSGSPVGGSTCH